MSSGFAKNLKLHLKLHGSLDNFDGEAALKQYKPSYFGVAGWENAFMGGNLYLHTVMGGYKSISASVTEITNNRITIKYSVTDFFGGDVGDAESNLPGLPGLYYIQHYGPKDKYKPFRWVVDIIDIIEK